MQAQVSLLRSIFVPPAAIHLHLLAVHPLVNRTLSKLTRGQSAVQKILDLRQEHQIVPMTAHY